MATETATKPAQSKLPPHQVILRPLVTEKGMHRSTRYNAYAFEVNTQANKYDIRHAAAVLHHHDHLVAGRDDAERVLSIHTTRTYAIALLLLASPFIGAVFAYQRAPLFFDALASAEVIVVAAVAFWFLAYRFMWKKELTFFHAAVPRIGAGIYSPRPGTTRLVRFCGPGIRPVGA